MTASALVAAPAAGEEEDEVEVIGDGSDEVLAIEAIDADAGDGEVTMLAADGSVPVEFEPTARPPQDSALGAVHR